MPRDHVELSRRYGFSVEQFSRDPDPHRLRRAHLIAKHPEIASMFGYDLRTAWVGLGVTVLQVALAFGVSRVLGDVARGPRALIVVSFAFLVGAILTHWLTMVIHETAHYLGAPTRTQNRVLALLCNIPCLAPIAMSFHRYHGIHHANLGVLGSDADMPMKWEIDLIGSSRAKKAVWLMFGVFFYTARNAVRIWRRGDRPSTWERINIASQLVALPLLFWLVGGWGIFYLGMSFYFAMTIHPVAAHFIHEHFVFAPNQETYSYYGPLNRVTFNVGYHVEHHDFDRIPGWRLPEFHRRYARMYDRLVSHRSWTWVLWHFVTSDMSLGSRSVRSERVRLRVVRA